MPRTRLSLVLIVAALLVAFGCARAMAQTTPPPTPPPPTFRHDRDTDFYARMTAALGALRDELDRIDRWHIPWGDAQRVDDARTKVDELAVELNDSTLLDSIQPRDQEEVDRLKAEADQHAGRQPSPQDAEQWKRDGENSWLLAMRWFSDRLAKMAAMRAPAEQPEQAEPPPAPTEARIGLRPRATLHLEDDPRVSVYLAAEEAAYWEAMRGRTDDLTNEQRALAEKRSRTADQGLVTAKEKAGRKLPATEIERLEQAGRAKGTEAGSAAEPSDEPPPAPATEDLAEQDKQGGDGGATKDTQPAASLDQVIGDDGALERDTPGLLPVTTTTEATETIETDAEGATTAPGGQIEQPKLQAGAGSDHHAVTDWFSGDDGLDGCLGKIRTSTIDGCGGTGDGPKLPPVDRGPEILPFPGFDGGQRGEEDGCKQGAFAAFGTCGLEDGHKPDIFTPGPIDLPGMTGCGPAGVIAICTGGDLGGSTVTTEPDLDLDKLFTSSGGAPASPLAPPPVVQPGSASSLAA